MKIKSYEQARGQCGVWIKFDNAGWRCVVSCYSPNEVREYALERVVHGNNVERVELREPTGECFDVIYSRDWFKPV